MADPEFRRGSDGIMTAKGPATTTAVQLPITKWNGSFTGNNVQVSNSRDGRARIAGNPDATGSATAHWDVANRLTDTTATGPGIRPGAIVDLLLAETPAALTDPLGSFRLTAIIDALNPSAEFEGAIDVDFTWSLQKGASLKFPGDA